MKNFVLTAMNLAGILLVLVGVFVFGGAISGKDFSIGAAKLPSNVEVGFFLIMLGLIMFGLSFVAGKILGRKS